MATKPENSEGKKAPADVEARQPAAPYAVDAPASAASNESRRQAGAGETFVHLAERLGLSQPQLSQALGLPTRLERDVSTERPFSTADQARIHRVQHIFSRALEVFEDADTAANWIAQRNRALGGVSPLSLLVTEPGYQLVLDTLGRIEFGVIS